MYFFFFFLLSGTALWSFAEAFFLFQMYESRTGLHRSVPIVGEKCGSRSGRFRLLCRKETTVVFIKYWNSSTEALESFSGTVLVSSYFSTEGP